MDDIIPEPRQIFDHESIVLTTNSKADMSCFSEKEISIINTVCSKMKGLSAREVSNLSHNEPAWQNHLHQNRTIPFTEAFKLVAV